MMTTRTTLLARLESLPRDLRAAEEELLEAAGHYAEARLALECRESDLLIRGVEGANEAQRKARLHIGSLQHAEAVEDALMEKDRAALQVRCLGFELRALEAISRLIGHGEEE